MKLLSDLRDYAFHYSRLIVLQTNEKISSFLWGNMLRLKGVQLGKGVRLIGRTTAIRAPKTNISIGSGTRMLSGYTANLHGLHRRTLISALRPGATIQIGSNCGFSGTTVCANTSVTIGDRVMIGANSTITDTDSHSLNYIERSPHHFTNQPADWRENVGSAPVRIEDDCWIGMNVTVLKGVTIGRGSVIAANSVVTKDCMPLSVYGGVPARRICSIDTAPASVSRN